MTKEIQNIIESELKEFDIKYKSEFRWTRERQNEPSASDYLRSSHSHLLEQVRLELVGEIEKERQQVRNKSYLNEGNYKLARVLSEAEQALSSSLAIINRILKQ